MNIEKERKPSQQEILGAQLTSYLTEHDPLGVGQYELLPLPAAEYHQNYKIETEKGFL